MMNIIKANDVSAKYALVQRAEENAHVDIATKNFSQTRKELADFVHLSVDFIARSKKQIPAGFGYQDVINQRKDMEESKWVQNIC